MMPLDELIPTLQLAVGPVILISGVGLILLSMTNRFGRVIDRARQLTHELRGANEAERKSLLEQLTILSQRARLVRSGITYGVFSVFLAALLIITLFVGALWQLQAAPVIVGLFVLCMLSLIICVLYFMSDINLSLQALWLEIPAEGRGER